MGPDIELQPIAQLADVFAAVESGASSCAVVPVENSLGGSVVGTYDLMLTSPLAITHELALTIEQCLMVRPGVTIGALRRVYSHPQALAQSERFLSGFPALEVHAVYDTAGAAKLVAEQKMDDAGAIASARAAEIYGLEILKRGTQDTDSNVTRFVRIARETTRPTGRDRTSIVFSVDDRPGILWKMLSIFAIRDINLKKLESRPSKRRLGEYVFYVDFDGHSDEPACARALDHLREIALTVKLLGSYPAAC
jgi:prephenate dehydratase